MAEILNQYGEVSRSNYEDVQTVARIGTAEMQLAGQFQTYHQEILSNFYRLAGHIYSAADLKKLRLENRPDFEWNLFLPVILSIVGNFKAAIPGVDFIGLTPDDQKGAVLQKTLSEYFLHTANDIQYELSKAFLYAVVGRLGWLKTSWAYNNDPDGMVEVEWYDSLRLKFDTNWTRRDTKDLRFISDAGWYEASEIIDVYAKKKPDLREEIYEKALLIVGETAMKKGRMRSMLLTWAERFLNASIDYAGRKHGYDEQLSGFSNLEYGYSGTWYNGDGRFKVVDWFEKRLQPKIEIFDAATGQTDDVSEDVINEKRDRMSDQDWFDREKLQLIRARYQDPRVTQTWDNVIWQTSVVPAMNLVLHDGEQKFQSGHFKFVPVMCFDFHPNVLEYKSVMDHIVDPVSSYNLRRNTILTYLMRLSHGGMIAEKGAVKGNEDSLQSNEIGGLKIVNDGSLSQGRIEQLQPPQYPEALKIEAESEKTDMGTISGSTPSVRGEKESSKESGVLYAQRIEQADTLQEWISDNAQAALVVIAKNNLAIAQRYLTMPRTIMLLRDETNPYWLQINQYYLGKLMNDVSYGRYNIRISKQPYGKYAREREFQKVMEMQQWLQTIDPRLVDPRLAIELSGVTVADRMIEHINAVMGEMENEMQQMEAVKAQEDQFNRAQSEVQLQQMLVGLEKSQLENYQLSEQMTSDAIMQEAMVNGGGRTSSPNINQLITQ